jgi:hypothetical protein
VSAQRRVVVPDDGEVVLRMTEAEAHSVHHAMSLAIDCMRAVKAVPASSPLYKAEPRLLLVGRRLSHERTHKGAVPNPHRIGGEDR